MVSLINRLSQWYNFSFERSQHCSRKLKISKHKSRRKWKRKGELLAPSKQTLTLMSGWKRNTPKTLRWKVKASMVSNQCNLTFKKRSVDWALQKLLWRSSANTNIEGKIKRVFILYCLISRTSLGSAGWHHAQPFILFFERESHNWPKIPPELSNDDIISGMSLTADGLTHRQAHPSTTSRKP